MADIRSILVATDFSPGSNAAVERAVQLARAHGASLCLLHAFDVSAWHSLKGVLDPQRLSLAPPPDVRMQQRLTDLAATLSAQTGIAVNAHFSLGSPEAALKAYSVAHMPSLIVLGSRADPAMLGLGSTVSKALRSPACPILIVRKAGVRPYGKVLSAIDMREGSVRAATIALTLFPAAHHHLLYAVELTLDPSRMGSADEGQIPEILESMHTQAKQELSQLAQSLSGLAEHSVTSDVADDVPDRAIVVRAAELPADCVVVGHHGEGPMSDRPLGSMSQHVLHHTLRDVLVVP